MKATAAGMLAWIGVGGGDGRPAYAI